MSYADYERFVNPLVVARCELLGEPYRITGVQGGRLVAEGGQLLDDFLSGWGTQAFGHRHPKVAKALTDFLASERPSFSTSGPAPEAGRLARLLCERSGLGRAAFFSGGSEAVEAALKLVRAASGKSRILAFSGAYHGCTYGSVAAMHDGIYRDGFGPHLPEVERLPWDDADALRGALAAGNVAAVLIEPVQVEGGVREPSPALLEVLAQAPVVIADEIQSGLGRTGRFLASETWPRRPDVVVLGKSLGGGLMPLSAVLCRRELADAAYGTHARAEAHASTFSGNALAAVAGLAQLELLDHAALELAAARGRFLHERLRASRPALVREIRGHGLLAGIVLDAERIARELPWLGFEYLDLPELAGKVAAGLALSHRLARAGFLTSVCGHDWSVLRIQPPLDTSEERLQAFTTALCQAIDELAGGAT